MDTKSNKEKYADLIQIVVQDQLIKNRILEVLQLSSYERRSVLNTWLEQLRLREASENLLCALSCLFDDQVAEEVQKMITDKLNCGEPVL